MDSLPVASIGLGNRTSPIHGNANRGRQARAEHELSESENANQRAPPSDGGMERQTIAGMNEAKQNAQSRRVAVRAAFNQVKAQIHNRPGQLAPRKWVEVSPKPSKTQ